MSDHLFDCRNCLNKDELGRCRYILQHRVSPLKWTWDKKHTRIETCECPVYQETRQESMEDVHG